MRCGRATSLVSTNSSVAGSRRMRVRRKSSASGAGLVGGGGGAGGVFGDLVPKAGEFAARRDVDAELLFLQRAEPAVGPAPEPDAGPHDAVGLFESRLALEECLGVVVEGEAGGLAVAGRVVVLAGEESGGERLAFGAVDAEVDGGLGKGAVEVADGEPGRRGEEGEADRQEAVVGAVEAVFHVGAHGYLTTGGRRARDGFVLVGCKSLVGCGLGGEMGSFGFFVEEKSVRFRDLGSFRICGARDRATRRSCSPRGQCGDSVVKGCWRWGSRLVRR